MSVASLYVLSVFTDTFHKKIALWAEPGEQYASVITFAYKGQTYTLDIERGLAPTDKRAAVGYAAAAREVIDRGTNLLEQQVWTANGPVSGRVHEVAVKANECYVDGVTLITDFRVRELPDSELTFRETVCPDCGVGLAEEFDYTC